MWLAKALVMVLLTCVVFVGGLLPVRLIRNIVRPRSVIALSVIVRCLFGAYVNTSAFFSIKFTITPVSLLNMLYLMQSERALEFHVTLALRLVVTKCFREKS